MQVISNILTIVFYQIPRWLFHHKAVLVLGVVVLVAWFGFSTFKTQTSGNTPVVEIPAYQKTAPDTPYVGNTPSRVYFIISFHQEGDQVILTDYYSYESDKWEKRPLPLTLKATQIEIVRR